MIVKTCVCKRQHTKKTWSKLAFVGTLFFEADAVIESRTCPCGSTIAIRRTRKHGEKEKRK